jgi:hypothetical protein
MCRLTSLTGTFSAHVMAARLQSEGIDVQLRGAFDGTYGFTVGDLARVDLWVPEDQLSDAELVLLASEVDGAMAAPSEWSDSPGIRTRRWPLWLAVTLVLVAVAPVVLAYLLDG